MRAPRGPRPRGMGLRVPGWEQGPRGGFVFYGLRPACWWGLPRRSAVRADLVQCLDERSTR